MFYKVMKDDRILDVLDNLTYVRYQKKNDIMIACDRSVSQAILSSNGNGFWHVYGLYRMPVDGYDTVTLVEIDQSEYELLRAQMKNNIPI